MPPYAGISALGDLLASDVGLSGGGGQAVLAIPATRDSAQEMERALMTR